MEPFQVVGVSTSQKFDDKDLLTLELCSYVWNEYFSVIGILLVARCYRQSSTLPVLCSGYRLLVVLLVLFAIRTDTLLFS